MKNLIAILAVSGFTIGATQAQLRLCPEAGINLSNLPTKIAGSKEDIKMKVGFKAGLMTDIGLVGPVSLQPGIMFSLKGGKVEEQYQSVLGNVDSKGSVSLGYIEIPVNVAVSFGGFFAFAGPYVGYAVTGKEKIEVTIAGQTEEDEADVEFGSDAGDTKRLDYGGNIGVGYKLPLGLYFRAQYGFGLANIVAKGDKDYSTKNTTIGLSVGLQIP